MNPSALEAASRAFNLPQFVIQGWRGHGLLQEHAPHGRSTEEQLAALMINLRAIGVDVLGSARFAESEIARLGLDVDVPVQQRPAHLRLAIEEKDIPY